MSRFIDLACLLESAAKALREADEKLAVLGPEQPPGEEMPSELIGYDYISPRVRRSLKGLSVNAICQTTAYDFRNSRNGIGQGAIREIREFLAKNGKRFRGDEPPIVATHGSPMTNGGLLIDGKGRPIWSLTPCSESRMDKQP